MNDEERKKRIEQQLQRANAETIKRQQEYEEERKVMESVNDDEEYIARFFRRMSKGSRG